MVGVRYRAEVSRHKMRLGDIVSDGLTRIVERMIDSMPEY